MEILTWIFMFMMANGNLIGSDTDYSDDCIVRWIPAWTGTFIIKVVNRGIYNNRFVILTN